jgi:hypothetical protein
MLNSFTKVEENSSGRASREIDVHRQRIRAARRRYRLAVIALLAGDRDALRLVDAAEQDLDLALQAAGGAA